LLHNSLQAISHQMSSLAGNEQQLEFVRWSTWFLANIFIDCVELPEDKYDASFVDCLSILFNCNDKVAAKNLVFACKRFTDTSDDDQLNALINAGVIEFCVKLLQSEDPDLTHQVPIITFLSRISDSDSWQRISDSGLFSVISTFLHSGEESMERDAFSLIRHFSRVRPYTDALVKQNCMGAIYQKLQSKNEYVFIAIYALSRAIYFESVGDEYYLWYMALVAKFIQKCFGILTGWDTFHVFGAIAKILDRNEHYWKDLANDGFLAFCKDFMKKRPNLSTLSSIGYVVSFVETEKKLFTKKQFAKTEKCENVDGQAK